MTSKISARYAKALFHSASKDQQRTILDNFDDIVKAYENIPRLRFFLESPEIDNAEKMKVIHKIINHKTNPLFSNFLTILLDKGRFKHLAEMAVTYRHIFTTTYGITDAQLVTTIPVDDKVKEQLMKKLEEIYQKKFAIKYEVDPQLIGGGVLVIEDTMIDFSVKGQLNKLKAKLLT